MSKKAPGVLGRLALALAPARSTAETVTWQPAGGNYPRLLALEPRALAGRAGLYLLWHLGVRPQWIRAGASPDLAATVLQLARAPEVADFSRHDGPFLSWSFCGTEKASGYVRFLTRRLRPALQDQVYSCDQPVDTSAPELFCVLPPGAIDIAEH